MAVRNSMRGRALAVVLLGLSLTTAAPLRAQDQPAQQPEKKAAATGRKFAKTPLLRAWFNLDEAAVNGYIQRTMDEYEVDSTFMRGAMRVGMKEPASKPELQGVMVFMAKGLIPSAVQVTFRTVDDEAQFKHEIFRVKNQLGGAATLTGSGDHYVLDLDFTKGIPIFGAEEGADGADEPQLMQIPGLDDAQNNPQALASLQQTIHFRLVGNVMWQGQMPEIMDFNFPSYEQLQPKETYRKYDVYGEFNLEEVPGYIRSLLFNTVNVAAKTQLQQRDDEESLSYDARRANGELWLEILRTVAYDIDRGRFSLQFATEDYPIRMRLDLDARSESNLAKVGRTISRVDTRFSALRDRTAPMTVASTWGMPESARRLFRATLALSRREWESEFAGDETLLSAAERAGSLLEETVEAGTVDFAVQLTGDVVTGFAVVGGIRVKQPDEMREALDQILSNLPDGSRVERTTDSAGRKYLTIGTGQVPVPGAEETFDAYLNLAAWDQCLWFSYGGPSSQLLLEDTLSFAEENRRGNVRGEAFRFRFDLSEWLAGDDSVDGFNQYPRQALLTLERKIDQGIGEMFAEISGRRDQDTGSVPARPSFFEKALEDGGDEVDVKLLITEQGVNLDVDIGLGVANMMLARMIDLQGRIMDAMMARQAQGQKPGTPDSFQKKTP